MKNNWIHGIEILQVSFKEKNWVSVKMVWEAK